MIMASVMRRLNIKSSKTMDWFLYDNGLRHEKVKYKIFKNICILFDVELMRMIRD